MGVDDTNKTILTSSLVAFFLDSLFFGIFFVTYAITIWLLVFPERRRQQYKRLDLAQAALLSVMLVLAFVYLILDVIVNVHAFAGYSGDLPSAEKLLRITSPESFWGARLVILVTQTILADGFLIYRLYVVWSRSLFIIIAPAFFYLGDAVFGYAMVNYQVHPEPGTFDGVVGPLLAIMTVLFFTSSFVTNVLTTGLISLHIIRSNRSVRAIRVGPALGETCQRSRVFDIMVQSAALYACALLAILITMRTAPSRPIVVVSILPSLAGAVFSLVILRNRLADATNPKPAHRVDLLAPPMTLAAPLSIQITREVSYDGGPK
ncbi:hypothetical protein C8Q79DRAFT_1003991 [Trametes meyenii]|nr:hypothetical protein C8Q79DRAFT_1003991 [Trametes meyenii]